MRELHALSLVTSCLKMCNSSCVEKSGSCSAWLAGSFVWRALARPAAKLPLGSCREVLAGRFDVVSVGKFE